MELDGDNGELLTNAKETKSDRTTVHIATAKTRP